MNVLFHRELVVFDISAGEVVSVASHLDAMLQNDCISGTGAPLLLQFALEHTSAHWVRFDFVDCFVQMSLPLHALIDTRVAFN